MDPNTAEIARVVRLPDDATEAPVAGSGRDDAGEDGAAEALVRAAGELAGIGQVDRLLDQLVLEGIRLTGADCGHARLLERSGQRRRGFVRRTSTGYPGNADRDRAPAGTASPDRSRIRGAASVPVCAPDGHAVAVLEFHAHGETFMAHERRLLTWLARIAAPTLLRTLDVQQAEEETAAVRREGQRWHAAAQRLADPHTGPAREAEALGRAVTATAHDLRTPLAALEGYVWLLESEQPPVDVDLVCAIRRQIRQLHALADELQVAVRPDRPAVSADPTSVDVAAVARQAARDLQVAVPGADVAVHAGPTVPALVDPGHLQRMLTNLLTNAVRYGRPPVEIRTRQRNGRVTVTVTDSGPGVPQPFVPRLFERFTRGPTAADVPGGTGLGLAIVRSLATANNATIRYRPNQPQGASFVIDLPAASGN